MYWKLRLSFLAVVVSAIFFQACKKQQVNQSTPLDLKEEARAYFDDVLMKQSKNAVLQESNRIPSDLQADWSQVKEERQQSFNLIVVPLAFSTKMPYSWSETKGQQDFLVEPFLAFFKNAGGDMVAEVVYKSSSQNSLKGKFDGNITVTDWSGTIKRSYRYTKGLPRRTSLSINYTKQTAHTEGVDCIVKEYYQDVYYGGEYKGTEFLYSKVECFESGGGSDGGGPSPGDGGGGSGGSGTGIPDYSNTSGTEATFNVDCGAITFTKTGTANWQEAGVTNLRFRWVWLGSAGDNRSVAKTVYINQVVVGLPLKYSNNTTLSPGQAAAIAARMIDMAKFQTYRAFKNSPYEPDDAKIVIYFREKLNTLMVTNGGTASVVGSKSPLIIYNQEKRTDFGAYNCN